jgi:hypothetical protein
MAIENFGEVLQDSIHPMNLWGIPTPAKDKSVKSKSSNLLSYILSLGPLNPCDNSPIPELEALFLLYSIQVLRQFE